MSVILDALRKLDREKSYRRQKTANIAVDILRSDAAQHRRRMSIYFFIVAGAAIAASAVTYGLMSKFGYLSKPSAPVTKTVPASGHSVTPAPAEIAVQSKFSPPSTTSPSSPSARTAPASGRQVASVPTESGVPPKFSPQPAAKPSPTRKVAPAPVETAISPKSSPPAVVSSPSETKPIPASPAPTRSTREEIGRVAPKVQSPAEKKEPADVKTPEEIKSPVVSVPHPPIVAANPGSLKLSAIAWYEDPASRFAMINGIMAKEGSLIEGIKVVEINPTSVRLLHDGQYFEISMSK